MSIAHYLSVFFLWSDSSQSALHSLQKFSTSSSFSSSSQVQITFSPQPSSSFSHGQITSPPQAPICMFRWIKFTTMLSLSLSLSLSVGLSAWVCLCISVLIYLCGCVCVCGYLVLLYKVWCGCKLELTNCILFLVTLSKSYTKFNCKKVYISFSYFAAINIKNYRCYMHPSNLFNMYYVWQLVSGNIWIINFEIIWQLDTCGYWRISQNRSVSEATFLIQTLNAHSTASTYLSHGILD